MMSHSNHEVAITHTLLCTLPGWRFMTIAQDTQLRALRNDECSHYKGDWKPLLGADYYLSLQ